MPALPRKTPCCQFVTLAFWLVGLTSLVSAQQLPLKSYTTAEGLAHNAIYRIVKDSRGFLWFCTGEGLSRFDGYTFTNYGVELGLPHRTVTDFLETRAGEFWLATHGGLVRFNPRGTPVGRVVYANEAVTPAPMFTVVVPEDEHRFARAATALLESRDGTIWCGTRKRNTCRMLDRSRKDCFVQKHIVEQRHQQQDAGMRVTGPETIDLKRRKHVASIEESQQRVTTEHHSR